MSAVRVETLSHGQFFRADQLPAGYRPRSADFELDPRPDKLDLGAGILRDDRGQVMAFGALADSLREISSTALTRGYPSPLGNVAFCEQIRRLMLGERAPELSDRTFSVQTIGSSQATRLIADCLVRLKLCNSILLSQESWADHRRIFERAGLVVHTHPYLAADGRSIDFSGMCQSLTAAAPGSAVLLQVGCHNPTGRSLSATEWETVIGICKERSILPILDAAYIGFAKGIEEDLAPVQECINQGVDVLIATSCCKMFSMYESRVGAITAIVSNAEIAESLRAQFRIEVQANHSSPPGLCAEAIAMVLNDPMRRDAWERDLGDARRMIDNRRSLLTEELSRLGASQKLLSIATQEGIFAWTGLDRDQSSRLRSEFGIYCPSNGRLSLATLPAPEIKRVARALNQVEKNLTA